MTGQEISQKLNSYLSGDILSIALNNTLGSPRLTTLLGQMLGGTMTATIGIANVQSDRVVYAGSKLGTADFLLYRKTSPVNATLTFYSGADNDIDLTVATFMPLAYALDDSFPGVLPPSLDAVALQGVSYTIDSTAAQHTAEMSATVPRSDSSFAGVAWMLGNRDLAVAGSVVVSTVAGVAYPLFSLTSATSASPQIAGFDLEAGLTIQSTLPTNSSGLLASVDVRIALGGKLPVPLAVSLLQKSQDLFTVRLDTSRALPTITAPSDLSDFTFGDDPGKQLDPDTPMGASLSLSQASITFDATKRTLSNLQLAVHLNSDWNIGGTPLPIKQLTLVLTVPTLMKSGLTTQGYTYSVAVQAVIAAGTTLIDVQFQYPAMIASIGLDPNTPLDPNDFIASFAGGASLPGSGDLVIYDLCATGDFKESTYSLSCAASGNLTIIPGFVLDDLEFSIEYANKTLDAFTIGCSFTLVAARATIYFSATKGANGWAFAGGLDTQQSVNLNDLVQDIASVFGLSIPSGFPEIDLTQLLMTYDTSDGAFSFDSAVVFIANDAFLKQMQGRIDIQRNNDAWTAKVEGKLAFGDRQELDAEYDLQKNQSISLEWKSVDGGSADLNALAELFGASLPSVSDLSMNLTELKATYDITAAIFAATATSASYGSATIVIWKTADTDPPTLSAFGGIQTLPTTSIDLTTLPLIDKVLLSYTLSICNISGVVSSADISPDAAAKINLLLNGALPAVPSGSMKKGLVLGATLNAGTASPQSIVVPITGSSDNFKAQDIATGMAGGDGTKWFTLQKTFGPLTVDKIGLRYESPNLWVLTNASLATGGLTVSVMGLGIGSPLTTFSPSFTIDGIAISFQGGPVEISGGLVGTVNPLNFYGELAISAGDLTISALGGYAQIDGHPSFFLYAVLDYPFGGPSFFFVTGLAAGFGYNRKLLVPGIDGISAFPLVQWAMGGGPSSTAGPDIGMQVSTVMDTLTSSGVVAPSVGDDWLALGIKFTSFELVNSFALLVATFGTNFEIDLLGLSTLSLPPDVDPPVAFVQLELKATFAPALGLLGIAGQLTPQSYLLDSACHLTGGFAFYSWFSGEHEGDFVITLGGYGAIFQPPSHYPVVPALGLNWQYGDDLSITGSLYFALTSNAVMAGGRLSALWSTGSVSAWFILQADFLMVFTPFHYYIDASIQLGASVSIDLLFTTVTITIHLGVGIEICGPPFAGKAAVNLSIVSFSIMFGAWGQNTDTTIVWDEFLTQLTPGGSSAKSVGVRSGTSKGANDDPSAAIVQFAVAAGLLKTLSTDPTELNYIVNGEDFALTVQSVIPFKTYDFSSNITLAPDSMQPQSGNATIVPNQDFGVGPTGTLSKDFTSSLRLTLTTNEATVALLAIQVFRNAPNALWQVKSFDDNGNPQTDPVNNTTSPNVLAGYRLLPAVTPPKHTRQINIVDLKYTLDPTIESFQWSTPTFETSDTLGNETLYRSIEMPPASSNRPLLIAAINGIGFSVLTDPNLDSLASQTNDYLLAAPMLRSLGEQKTS